MSTRHLDPPTRAGWVRRLPPHKAATALLRQYIESRVGCDDKRESASCKTFLRTVNAAMANDNAAGIELAVVRGPDFGTVAIFHYIRGVGQIPWLPTLVTHESDRLKQIRRETSASRVALDLDGCSAVVKAFDDGSPSQRRIPPKPETRVIPGFSV